LYISATTVEISPLGSARPNSADFGCCRAIFARARPHGINDLPANGAGKGLRCRMSLIQRLACTPLLDRFAREQPCRSVCRAAHHYPLRRRAFGNGACHSLAIGTASRCRSARHTGLLDAKARALRSFGVVRHLRSLPHPGARLAANVLRLAWPPGYQSSSPAATNVASLAAPSQHQFLLAKLQSARNFLV
jgi:hypothetical protein